jgi:TonB family protein
MTESRARIAGVKNREAELLRRAPWLLSASMVTRWCIVRAETAVNYHYDYVPDPFAPARDVYGAEAIIDSVEMLLEGAEHALLGKPTDLVQTIPLWRVEIKPQPVDIPQPAYPEQARAAGATGHTTVDVLVGIDGKVDSALIQESSGHAVLDSAALKAARRARYKPGTQFGVPVRVWLNVTYRFPPRRK